MKTRKTYDIPIGCGLCLTEWGFGGTASLGAMIPTGLLLASGCPFYYYYYYYYY